MSEIGNQQERRDASIYLAAMIQGEGSVMCYVNYGGGRNRNSFSVAARVVIYNGDLAVVNELQRYCKILEAGEYRYGRDPIHGGYQRIHVATIMISGYKRLARFLPHVIPYLVGIKKTKAEMLLKLSASRAQKSARDPYETWEWEYATTICPGKKRLESSETNMPSAADQAVKIEPDPLAKALGGEPVRQYPAYA